MKGETSAEEAVGVVKRCFEALSSLDVEALCANYTEDYILELPYFKPDEALVIEGRENVRPYLESILGIQQINITLTGSHWIAEQQLLIAEYVSEGSFLDTGEAYANRYVGYWYLCEGRVRRLREYYNPQAPRASAID